MNPLNEKIINLTWRAASQHDIDRFLTAVCPQPIVYLDGAKTTLHGHCDTLTGTIYVRTHTLHKNSRPLHINTLCNTIGHEVAHLVEVRHGRPHRLLTNALASWLASNWANDPIEQPQKLIDILLRKR